ncbi:hypothetical protein TGPRC2_279405 [Toxoplasma gondii TgCatPRC2]|uniref:Uncharacterized protein n=2 Tax=Toxoplasma gondii TaxID=5811 RepID=A0A151H640_TOXGO|nr:hypothetical protein TGP89_279405 [Toxoplasma gondii p89]KYK64837.1 hypothetical protein TGPRC2_279405 [Toxoplasma gondii TgCatPRC2]
MSLMLFSAVSPQRALSLSGAGARIVPLVLQPISLSVVKTAATWEHWVERRDRAQSLSGAEDSRTPNAEAWTTNTPKIQGAQVLAGGTQERAKDERRWLLHSRRDVQPPILAVRPIFLQQPQRPSATSSVSSEWTDLSSMTIPHVCLLVGHVPPLPKSTCRQLSCC